MEPQKMKDIFNPNDLEKKHTPVIEGFGESGNYSARDGRSALY